MCIQEIKKLRSGFDAVNDISKLKPTSPEGTKEIERAMKFVQERGVKRVIRVVSSEQVITSQQYTRKSKDAGYLAKVVTSIQEADEILDRGE